MQRLRNTYYICSALLLSSMSQLGVAIHAFEPALVRSQSPGNVLRFSPPSMTFISDEAKRAYNVKASYASSNLWGHDRGYVIDAQVDDTLCELNYAVAPEFSVTLGFGQRAFRTSQMDEIIVSFHELIDSPQGKRLQVDADQSRISLPGYNLEITDTSIDRSFSSHVYAAGNVQLPLYDPSAQLALGGIFYQTTSDGLSSSKGDMGFGIRGRMHQKISDVSFYSEIALIYHKNRSKTLRYLKQRQLETRLGLAYKLKQDHDIYLQSLVSEAAFDGFGQLAKPSFEIHFAYRYSRRYLALDFGMIENILYPFNSPDWGLFVGLSAVEI